jgi:hypothetical protein
MGLQVDLMLMGKKPSEVMRWFEQLELFPVIFTTCVKDSNPPLLGNNGRCTQESLKCLALGHFGPSAQLLCIISLEMCSQFQAIFLFPDLIYCGSSLECLLSCIYDEGC